MTLSDDQFNQALAIFQEFGPRRRIPVDQRWQEAFPDAAVDDRQEWKRVFDEIEDFAYALAEKVLDGGLDAAAAKHQLASRFPRLSSDQVSRTFGQAQYFASK